MKIKLILSLLLVVGMSVSAGIYSIGNVNGGGTSLDAAIPDNNANGYVSQIAVSGEGSVLSDVTVTLNVADGYNGDLYAYLEYDGTMVTLLNRVGTGSGDVTQETFGFSTAGFNNVTLSDAGTGGDIHDVANPGSLPAVSYMPDDGSLASFNSMDPNGTWTLFLADLSAGDTSTLVGWSVDIAAVPEPMTGALELLFGVLGALAWVVFHRWKPRAVLKAGRFKGGWVCLEQKTGIVLCGLKFPM